MSFHVPKVVLKNQYNVIGNVFVVVDLVVSFSNDNCIIKT